MTSPSASQTPKQVLIDNGTQVVAARGEESSFTKALEEMGIEHITSSIGKPTTLGKIERWFHTYDDEELRRFKNLEDAVRSYNVIGVNCRSAHLDELPECLSSNLSILVAGLRCDDMAQYL